MTGILSVWWVWLSVALALGIVEVLAPGFIFLGFAVGALVMAGLVTVLPGLSVAALLAIFAALSLLAWVALRRLFQPTDRKVRTIKHDIND